MTYPFAKMPTLREFIAKAANFGAKEQEIKINGPRGQARMRGLLRERPGRKPLLAVLPDIDEDQALTPTVLRSLCNKLKIPPRKFGLDLG